MIFDLSQLKDVYPHLQPVRRPKGETAYRLPLPALPSSMSFEWAEIRIERGFPETGYAQIYLSPDAVLRVPHVERTGRLCMEGDPGPGSLPAEDRILLLLQRFKDYFLTPLLGDQLARDFESEPLSYWDIRVKKERSIVDPVSHVWTVNDCPESATVTEGRLFLPSRVVVAAGEDEPLTNRIARSLGPRGSQRVRVRVADIPIDAPLTPLSWPRNAEEIDRLLHARLTPKQQRVFLSPKGAARGEHRIVLLRNQEYGFAFLLPGGPPTLVRRGQTVKAYPCPKLLPLGVSRVDPSWTVGRDQHPEVKERQQRWVVVLGAGALGSPLIEHLTKAGVGRITVVDPDILSTANIGRHLLGLDDVQRPKAAAVAQRLKRAQPAAEIEDCYGTAEEWLDRNSLREVDLLIDVTGEPDVRRSVELARNRHTCPLLIAWMEPYVAAAHACVVPAGVRWLLDSRDRMRDLEAVDWPEAVYDREPGCSSRFQSYTAAAAAHAVALTAEKALSLIDDPHQEGHISSWVRGQEFLNRHARELTLRDWAREATWHDGLMIRRPFP